MAQNLALLMPGIRNYKSDMGKISLTLSIILILYFQEISCPYKQHRPAEAEAAG